MATSKIQHATSATSSAGSHRASARRKVGRSPTCRASHQLAASKGKVAGKKNSQISWLFALPGSSTGLASGHAPTSSVPAKPTSRKSSMLRLR
jgi:hypothetical protein